MSYAQPKARIRLSELETYDLKLQDPAAWVHEHGDAMFAYALSRVRKPDVAEDLVQDALLAALESGHLAGAGLDVTEPEPLPADHPLWSQPNAVITPHMGGTSDRVSERRVDLVKRNLRHFVAAEPLENVVDKAEWY